MLCGFEHDSRNMVKHLPECIEGNPTEGEEGQKASPGQMGLSAVNALRSLTKCVLSLCCGQQPLAWSNLTVEWSWNLPSGDSCWQHLFIARSYCSHVTHRASHHADFRLHFCLIEEKKWGGKLNIENCIYGSIFVITGVCLTSVLRKNLAAPQRSQQGRIPRSFKMVRPLPTRPYSHHAPSKPSTPPHTQTSGGQWGHVTQALFSSATGVVAWSQSSQRSSWGCARMSRQKWNQTNQQKFPPKKQHCSGTWNTVTFQRELSWIHKSLK